MRYFNMEGSRKWIVASVLFFLILTLFSFLGCSSVISRTGDSTDRQPAAFQSSDYFRYYIRSSEPRSGCVRGKGSCSQANECCSNLCLSGKCVDRVFPTQCLDIGAFCVSNSECCSKSCLNQVCMGSQDNYCGYVGQLCFSRYHCCSDECSVLNFCNGTAHRECAIVGQTCDVTAPNQCCSGSCYAVPGEDRGRCVGGTRDPGRTSEICRFDDQCLSGKCRLRDLDGVGSCL